MASESDKPFQFLHLEIIINILKRLPIKSIVRFQCVCKAWKNLFRTQSFIAEHARHFAHENPFLLIHTYDYNFRRVSLRLLDQKMQIAEVLSTNSLDSFRRGWRIMGSSNGLLCVELDSDEERFPISHLLWNPVNNEVREVPQTLNDYRRLSRVGFGYSSVVNDYKIVRLYNQELLKKKEDQGFYATTTHLAQVYSLSTGSWKELDIGSWNELELGAFHTEFAHEAVCANGTIFWFGWAIYPMIVSFDIATELFAFTRIRTLPSTADVVEHCPCPYRPHVYGNKLAMCDGIHLVIEDSRTYSIQMWVVEEGAGESGKSLSCTQKYKIGPLSSVLKPLCIWRNEIVCTYKEGEAEVEGDPKNFLYLFSLTTKEWRMFPNFSAIYNRCAMFNYEKSLATALQHIG